VNWRLHTLVNVGCPAVLASVESRLAALSDAETAAGASFCTRPAVGDLVIWDNRCTMHRGRPHDDAHPRDLRRATTLDAGSTLDEAA
jgi:alpha-ketoglutarate-dependent 2,4-dichlorophenoxyacetate dioxygenase